MGQVCGTQRVCDHVTQMRLTLRWDPEPTRRLASSCSSAEKITFIRQFKQSSYPPVKHQRVRRPPAALWHIYIYMQPQTHKHTQSNLTFTPFPPVPFEGATEESDVYVWYLISVLCVHLTRCHVFEEQRQRLETGVTGCQVKRSHFFQILQPPISMTWQQQFHEPHISLKITIVDGFSGNNINNRYVAKVPIVPINTCWVVFI